MMDDSNSDNCRTDRDLEGKQPDNNGSTTEEMKRENGRGLEVWEGYRRESFRTSWPSTGHDDRNSADRLVEYGCQERRGRLSTIFSKYFLPDATGKGRQERSQTGWLRNVSETYSESNPRTLGRS